MQIWILILGINPNIVLTLRQHTFLLATLLLLTSCTHDEVQEVGRVMSFRLVTDNCDTIRTDNIGSTRAPDGVNDNATFIFPADFTVAVDGINYIYTANSAGTNMIGWSIVAFPVSGNSVKVQAFYPALLTNNSTQSFTVRYNQSQTSIGTANYRLSDLMYGVPIANGTYAWGTWNSLDSSGKVIPTDDPIPLVFEHKMVKIRIDVITNGATVKQITMKNVLRSIDFNTADASFSGLVSAADGFGDKVMMYDNASGSSTNFTCTALIPQQDLTANTPFIDVVVEAQPSDLTMTYSLHDAASFKPGKQYIYNLAVSMDKLEVSCSIAGWNTPPAGWLDVNETLTL